MYSFEVFVLGHLPLLQFSGILMFSAEGRGRAQRRCRCRAQVCLRTWKCTRQKGGRSSSHWRGRGLDRGRGGVSDHVNRSPARDGGLLPVPGERRHTEELDAAQRSEESQTLRATAALPPGSTTSPSPSPTSVQSQLRATQSKTD